MEPNDASCLHVACAADENYALPLAVTVRSLLNRLSSAATLHLYVLNGGLSTEAQERLTRSWHDPRLKVEWLDPDLKLLDELPVSGHVTRTAYARLLLPALLPQTLSKVIYLDSDLLVQRDLSDLWREPFDGHACLAIVDAAAPWIDAEIASPKFAACGRYLAAARPVPNYRELGLNPRAPYFNSGVLCLDLDVWRAQGIVSQALRCLEEHRQHVLWWDQYALNVVLHGRWRPLDMRWNQGTHLYCYPTPAECPFPDQTAFAAKRDPWIVHFTSPLKPWHFECSHPYRRRFIQVVDQTVWKGWRPAKPYRSISEWFDYERQRFSQWRKRRRAIKAQRRKSTSHKSTSRKAA